MPRDPPVTTATLSLRSIIDMLPMKLFVADL
jgi:hypothetical protein